jgi:hypothetical protein
MSRQKKILPTCEFPKCPGFVNPHSFCFRKHEHGSPFERCWVVCEDHAEFVYFIQKVIREVKP